jgi:hypothetical protein
MLKPPRFLNRNLNLNELPGKNDWFLRVGRNCILKFDNDSSCVISGPIHFAEYSYIVEDFVTSYRYIWIYTITNIKGEVKKSSLLDICFLDFGYYSGFHSSKR